MKLSAASRYATKDTIIPGTRVYTDEYSMYARLQSWGYDHKSVNHGRGEFARDDDGDGFCEVHVNTMEGFWSLLRSWLRPHRGISREEGVSELWMCYPLTEEETPQAE